MSSDEQVDVETGEVTKAGEAGSLVSFGGIGRPVAVELDPEAIQRRILERVFEAKSLDELFGVWSAKTSDQLEGRTFEVRAVRWGEYESERGPIPLAEVSAIDKSSGKDETFVTTAVNLTAFLAQAEAIGELPFTARIAGARTRSGQTSLHFEQA